MECNSLQMLVSVQNHLYLRTSCVKISRLLNFITAIFLESKLVKGHKHLANDLTIFTNPLLVYIKILLKYSNYKKLFRLIPKKIHYNFTRRSPQFFF